MTSTDVNFIASQAIARSQQQQQQQQANGTDTNGLSNGDESQAADPMAALERQAKAPMGFVAASSGPEGGSKLQSDQKAEDEKRQAVPVNPDAIDLGDDI